MQHRCFLLAGLVLLPKLSANAQQPTRSDSTAIYTRADSAAVFARAVERILAADSARNMRLGANAPLRLIKVPEESWAAPAVERLRRMERPGEDGELVTVSAPWFGGIGADVTETRRHCSLLGPNYAHAYVYYFVRADTGWQYMFEGRARVDMVCAIKVIEKRPNRKSASSVP